MFGHLRFLTLVIIWLILIFPLILHLLAIYQPYPYSCTNILGQTYSGQGITIVVEAATIAWNKANNNKCRIKQKIFINNACWSNILSHLENMVPTKDIVKTNAPTWYGVNFNTLYCKLHEQLKHYTYRNLQGNTKEFQLCCTTVLWCMAKATNRNDARLVGSKRTWINLLLHPNGWNDKSLRHTTKW